MRSRDGHEGRIQGRWPAVFGNDPGLITELDREDRVLITKRAPGNELDGVVGKPIYDRVPPKRRRGLRDCIDGVIGSGEPTSIDFRFRGQRAIAGGRPVSFQ